MDIQEREGERAGIGTGIDVWVRGVPLPGVGKLAPGSPLFCVVVVGTAPFRWEVRRSTWTFAEKTRLGVWRAMRDSQHRKERGIPPQS